VSIYAEKTSTGSFPISLVMEFLECINVKYPIPNIEFIFSVNYAWQVRGIPYSIGIVIGTKN